jgi:ubiquinone/menaquinone biosynthesis C-methylase UbiE
MATPVGPARAFFDLWSLVYDQPLVQRLTYRPVHDGVVEVLRSHRPRRVLDLGCGTGLLSARLRAELAGVEVVGCDYSRGMLREAHARAAHAPWTQGDAMRLPFRTASFDAVVSTEAFHWFPDQPAALREVHRVLAPSGRVVLALVNPPIEGIGEVIWWATRIVGQPFYWPTPRGMRGLLSSAGFHVEEQRRLWRIPGGLLLPAVLSVAVRE